MSSVANLGPNEQRKRLIVGIVGLIATIHAAALTALFYFVP